MTDSPTPRFHPISALSMIAEAIDGMLSDAETQWQNLDVARDKPYVLDDATIQRVSRCYCEQQTYVPIYVEQLARWAKLELTRHQRDEVERLQQQIAELVHILFGILTLAAELKENTIEKLLAKDDAEVALDVLLGKLKMP